MMVPSFLSLFEPRDVAVHCSDVLLGSVQREA